MSDDVAAPGYRAVVVCNGDPPSQGLAMRMARGADLVVCTDGAAEVAVARGLRVDAVVGDMDSGGTRLLGAHCVDAGPHDLQDNTDSEKALLYAIERAEAQGFRGAEQVEILMLGATGTRIDHAFANIQLCLRYACRAAVRLVSDHWELHVVVDRLCLDLPVPTTVSLLPLLPGTQVRTTGLRWELAGVAGPCDFGVSNRAVQSQVVVDVSEGALAVVVLADEGGQDGRSGEHRLHPACRAGKREG